MTLTTERRLAALEARHGAMRSPMLMLVRLVKAGYLDVFPSGTLAALPYLPAVDRLPGESWDAFGDRLEGMIAHLPSGVVMQVISRTVPE